MNTDLGLRWFGSELFVEGYVFWNGIDNYIEQVEIQPDVATFVNLVSGRIVGAELQGYYQIVPSVAFEFSGHYLEGRSDADVPLGDIPSNRLTVGFRGGKKRWNWRVNLEHRFEKTDVSPDEKPLPSAELLSFRVSYDVTTDLALALTGRNLLDESYFNSPDRKVLLSAGRSIGLALSWSK